MIILNYDSNVHFLTLHCRLVEGELEMNAVYPGLPLFYSLDAGKTWLPYKAKVKVDVHSPISLMSK